MLSQSSVTLGLEALKQGHYLEAIELLEKLEQLNKVNSEPALKEYMAQLGLVKAYHGNGQQDKAIALCQQLTRSNNPQVQAWAQKALQSLHTIKAEFPLPQQTEQQTVLDKQLLTSQQADELLKSGNKALKLKRYPQAVAALEEFCYRTESSTKNYSQAQMWLVKAYKGNEQLEKAIALCQQLTTSEQQVLQIWAKQFILTLVPLEALQKETETQEDNQSPNASDLITTTTDKATDVGIKMKTLSELNVFYQKTLLHDLKAIEVKRQQIVQ